MTRPNRLYGLPGSEYLVSDLSTVVDEAWDDSEMIDDESPESMGVVVEEFTVKPVTAHIPSRAAIIEWITEWDDEITEDFAEEMQGIGRRADIEAIVDALRVTWALHIRYAMADQHVATHHIRRTLSAPDETTEVVQHRCVGDVHVTPHRGCVLR